MMKTVRQYLKEVLGSYSRGESWSGDRRINYRSPGLPRTSLRTCTCGRLREGPSRRKAYEGRQIHSFLRYSPTLPLLWWSSGYIGIQFTGYRKL